MGSIDELALVRLNGDGSLDTSFNGSGMLTRNIDGAGTYGMALAVDPSSRLVVAAKVAGGSVNSAVLRMAMPMAATTWPSAAAARLWSAWPPASRRTWPAWRCRTTAKIVVVGSAYNGSNNDVAVFRLLADGTLDTSFNSGGKLTRDISGATDAATAVAIAADGRIVVVGSAAYGAATASSPSSAPMAALIAPSTPSTRWTAPPLLC